jgi:TP901 family phage tail tape measure protein
MATLFTVGIEVQASKALQAVDRMEKALGRLGVGSSQVQNSTKSMGREFDQAAREVSGMAKQIDLADREARKAAKGFDLMAVAAGNLVSGAIQGAFESLTSKFQQLAQGILATGEAAQSAIAANSTLAKDAEGLDKAFRQLTKDLNYQTNSVELNSAAYDVLSAGVTETADVLNVMRAGVAGARGGFSDLATMTDAVTTVMNAYGKSASEAQKIVDMMITTQNDGKIVAGQYAQQIGVVAAGASSAGVKLEELNAAVAVSTVAGVQVSSTFTGLRQAISSIVSPSEQAKKVAKELGIEFSQAALKQKGFAGVLKDVAQATKGNADQITKLFGSVEAKAVLDPILNNLERYNQFLNNQTQAAGAAATANQKVAQGYKATAENLANVAKELERNAAGAVLPAVQGINQLLSDALIPLAQNEQMWKELTAQSIEFQSYLKENPQLAKAFGDAMEQGLRTGLEAATDLAKGLLGYLQENPDAIAKAVKQVDLLVKGLGEAYKIIALAVEGWEKIAGLAIAISGGDRVTPTSGAERILRAGGTSADAQSFQQEVNKRVASLPFWDAFNNAKKEEVTRQVLEEVLMRVERQQRTIRRAGESPSEQAMRGGSYGPSGSVPFPQTPVMKAVEEQGKAQEAVAKKALSNSRELGQAEIKRLQAQLDLDKSRGLLSDQEEIKRRAQIRLAQNQLAIEELRVKQSEKMAAIAANAPEIDPRNYANEIRAAELEAQAIRAESEKQIADLQRKRRQEELDARRGLENSLFGLKVRQENELANLRQRNANFLLSQFERGGGQFTNQVISGLKEINALVGELDDNLRSYRQEEQRLVAEWNSIQDQIGLTGEQTPGQSSRMEGIKQEVAQAQRLYMERDKQIRAELAQAKRNQKSNITDGLRRQMEDLNQQAAEIDRQRAMVGLTGASKDQAELERLYNRYVETPALELAAARDKAEKAGNMQLAGSLNDQLNGMIGLVKGENSPVMDALTRFVEAQSLLDQAQSRNDFSKQIERNLEAEVERTKELQTQRDLLMLQGQDKKEFLADLKVQELTAKRLLDLEVKMSELDPLSERFKATRAEYDALVESLPTIRQKILENLNAQEVFTQQIEVFNEQMRMSQAIADGLGNSLGNAFGEFILGTKSAQQAFAGMLGNMANVFAQEVQRMVSQKAAQFLFGGLFNLFGGGGGGGFALSGITGTTATGMALPGFSVPALADGGIVRKPTMALIGERGPEAVVPLGEMGGNQVISNVTVNVSNDGSVKVDNAQGNELGRAIQRAVVDEIARQKRGGGLLSSVK